MGTIDPQRAGFTKVVLVASDQDCYSARIRRAWRMNCRADSCRQSITGVWRRIDVVEFLLIVIAIWCSHIAIATSGEVAKLPDLQGKRHFRILDAKATVLAEKRSPWDLSWVGNHEVLFVESVPPSSPTESYVYRLSLWNIKSNTIKAHGNYLGKRLSLCFRDGYVAIWLWRDSGQEQLFHGKLGEEIEDDPKRSINRFLCRPVTDVPALPAWTKGREVHWLEAVDGGFIDFGEGKEAFENSVIKLYRHGEHQEAGKVLPFGRREITKRFPYYRFRDAYLIRSYYYLSPRPRGVPYPIFWLYRDGRVERIAEIPWGLWRNQGSVWFEPTKAGVLIVSTNARSESELGQAGLYLLVGGEVRKLLSAWIRATAVSPDGCKVAFDYADKITRKQNHLRAIDLCAGD